MGSKRGLAFTKRRRPVIGLVSASDSYRKEILFISEEDHVCEDSKLFDSVLDHLRVIALRFVNHDEISVSGSIFHGVFDGWRGRAGVPGSLAGSLTQSLSGFPEDWNQVGKFLGLKIGHDAK